MPSPPARPTTRSWSIDAHDQPKPPFRSTPRGIQSIENNLSIANMDFEEFAAAVDLDGIFRGF